VFPSHFHPFDFVQGNFIGAAVVELSGAGAGVVGHGGGLLEGAAGFDAGIGGAWRLKAVQKHLQHARKHLDLLASGFAGEDHLAHAACRLLMALELRERTARTQPAGPSSAQAANECDQMPLFSGMAPIRQT
jgi:hypothetical protein